MPLDILSTRFTQLPEFVQLVQDLPGTFEEVSVTGLYGSADSILVASLSEQLRRRLFVVVADSVSEAERWLTDLQVVLPAERVAFYPPRDGFGEMEPHAEVAGERIETLERFSHGDFSVLVTTMRAVQERTTLPGALKASRLELKQGGRIRPQQLSAHLDEAGFERAEMVDDVGQYSMRGGIFDIYGFGMAEPVRLEFWGDEISSVRHFDVQSQRSTRDAALALILPIDDARLRARAAPERISVADLWPTDAIVVRPVASGSVHEHERTWADAQHHIDLARRRGEEVAERHELFLDPQSAQRRLEAFPTVRMLPKASGDSKQRSVHFPTRAPENVDRNIQSLRILVRGDMPTMVLCDNSGQVERLYDLLEEGRGAHGASVVVGAIDQGFIIPPRGGSPGLRVLTDHEVFRRGRRIRRSRKYSSGTALDLSALRPGDYVVHLDHGVGLYRGIEQIELNDSRIEVAVVEYEGGDRLNVPLYRIDQIERYRAAGDASDDATPPKLHRLGGKRWKRQRDTTWNAINEMTSELLDLYSRRSIATRTPHKADTDWQRQLESSFLFEDTADQRKASQEVKSDMEGERPMDRLLVGDVGYGKTEVAVRAAFKAVQSGRQVAVLVPTTILADQHARSFGERLADFPISVRALSRFESAAEQKLVVEDLAAGKVDIVIGTHRLLSPDVKFANLGLIVVDEEHRFGVKHKERLKQLKLDTDVLTLTATPIPRTLHQSLAGLRDMTLMQTAPRDRSPVLTHLEPFDDALIEEGIARELDRGGQVFFVHNRIETIDAMAQHIQRLAPSARFRVAHGQMKEKELEEVMHAFASGEVDVLLSTMIVESGLDVPNANTMFVNHAERFGLAQLYQLRGRVGRSHRRAWCYLLVGDAIDADAERRLKILEHHTELGSGYRIALRDMELRGAGNLLGPEQSGFVHAVGFDMYLRMLDEAVTRLKSGDGAPVARPAEVTVDAETYLPEQYIPGADAKLDVYRRLSRVTSADQIAALRDELRDRFGQMPAAAGNLLHVAMLRVIGGEMGVEGILVRGNEARVNFRSDAIPRLRGMSAAFGEVQFAAEVRRSHPLSLKLTRLGGAEMLDGLVRALRTLL